MPLFWPDRRAIQRGVNAKAAVYQSCSRFSGGSTSGSPARQPNARANASTWLTGPSNRALW